MEQPRERVDRLEILRGLMERLCGADLTLDEAKSLRIQVLILLEHDDLCDETDAAASSPKITRTAWTAGTISHGMSSEWYCDQ
jgi:hypothetical protein